MKSSIRISLGAVLLLLSFSVCAWALPYPVVENSIVTMFANDTAAQYEGHYQYTVGNTTAKYGAFCVELNEYFTPGQTYKVANISPYAESGGIGGATNGKDYLSDATKWLFYHFLAKDIYAVTGKAENDYSLQLAFWKLEDELNSASSYLNAYNADTVAQTYYDKAKASATAGATYDVMVMNLVDSNGVKAQSQLVGAAPVPEPGTMMLLGVGTLCLVIFGKRRMNKDS